MLKKHFKLSVLALSSLGLIGCSSLPGKNSYSYADPNLVVPAQVSHSDSDSTPVIAVEQIPMSKVDLHFDSNTYGNMRRAITLNQEAIPATHFADWLNYFNYDFRSNNSTYPFTLITEIAPSPWNDNTYLMLVGVKAEQLTQTEPVNNIVLLVDTGTGMKNAAGLELVKETLTAYLPNLSAKDRVSIITYSDKPKVLVNAVSGQNQKALTKAIDNLSLSKQPDEQPTQASINLAYEVLAQNRLNGNNEILFLTDGNLNMTKEIAQSMSNTLKQGNRQDLHFSTLVFNSTNYNYQAMGDIAKLGGGKYAYIDTINEGLFTFRDLFAGPALGTDASFVVEFNSRYVDAYQLLGYTQSRAQMQPSFNRSAATIKPGQNYVALYRVSLSATERNAIKNHNNDIAVVSFKYKDHRDGYPRSLDRSLLPKELKSHFNQASDAFKFASAVASFGLKMQNDPVMSSVSSNEILSIAKSGVNANSDGAKQEFVALVEQQTRQSR